MKEERELSAALGQGDWERDLVSFHETFTSYWVYNARPAEGRETEKPRQRGRGGGGGDGGGCWAETDKKERPKNRQKSD